MSGIVLWVDDATALKNETNSINPLQYISTQKLTRL
jgi:hypothetical protein